MTRQSQRGPLLPSIIMVLMATMATGLLAVIGFQALPDSVIPSTFGAHGRENRNVNVSDGPTTAPRTVAPSSAKPTATATTGPTATRTQSATTAARPTTGGVPTKNGTATTTTAPKPVKTSPPPSKKATSSPTPTKTVSPSPTQTTQTPTPAPTCGPRKPRCNTNPTADPQATPTDRQAATYSSYGTASDGDERLSYARTRDSARLRAQRRTLLHRLAHRSRTHHAA